MSVYRGTRHRVMREGKYRCVHCRKVCFPIVEDRSRFIEVGPDRWVFEKRFRVNYGEMTIDHIRPRVEGGSSRRENLQILCRRCNSSKGARVAA